MTILQAIEQEIDAAKNVCPFGEPLVSFDPRDVLIDRDQKRIYITMRAIQNAFGPSQRGGQS